MALHYVPHLDQVWVLNWRSVYDDGVKTIQVIRDASQKRKHHTVHPEPIDGQFDLVRNLFMPIAQVREQNTKCLTIKLFDFMLNIIGFEPLVQIWLRKPCQSKRTLQTGLGQYAVHKEH